MTEQTIKGQILGYSEITTGTKGSGETWARITVTVEKTKFGIFANTAEPLEKLKASAPLYSTVEVTVWKPENGKYWNYKDKSLKVLEKADSNTTKKSPATTGGSQEYWEAKTELEKRRYERLEFNDPAYIYKDLLTAVLGSVTLDIRDMENLEKDMQTITSITDELYIATNKKSVEMALQKKKSSATTETNDDVQNAQEDDII